MLFPLIMQDIKRGLHKNRVKLMLFLLYIITISVGYCFNAFIGLETPIGIAGMICVKLLAGIPIFRYEDGLLDVFLPASWLLMVLFLIYILGDYVYDDMSGIGVYKLVLTGRLKWWISKMAYVFVILALYITILVGVPFIMTTIFNKGKILKPSNDVHFFAAGFGDMYSDKSVFFTYIVLIPFLCLLSLSIWQTVLSLIFTPQRAFIIMTSYITIGIYNFGPYFIGNQLMYWRTDMLNIGGLNPVTSIWIDFVLIIFGLLIGYTVVKNRDMID